MLKKYFALYLVLFLLSFSIHQCSSDSKKKTDKITINGQNELTESFRKTGWIDEGKYRAIVFIITKDECDNSSLAEIEEKIKFEAFKNLQKDLNPSFNRNASTQIKILADNFGKMVKADNDCKDGNVYFYDLEKKDLKQDFEKIKNLK